MATVAAVQLAVISGIAGFEQGVATTIFTNIPIAYSFGLPKSKFEPVMNSDLGAIDADKLFAKYMRFPLLGTGIPLILTASHDFMQMAGGFMLISFSALTYLMSTSHGMLDRAWKFVKEKIAALNAKPVHVSVSKFENSVLVG